MYHVEISKNKKLTKKDPLKFLEITLQEEDEDQEEVEKEGERGGGGEKGVGTC